MEQFKDFQNILAMLSETVARRGRYPAYRWFTDDGELASVTWDDFHSQVRQVAGSLIALGVRKDDKIAILSYSCYRWVLTDLAAASIGAVSVGIYQSLPARDCRYIIEHCDAVLAFAEDRTQLDKLLEIRDEIPAVRRVVLFNGESTENDWVMDYEEFIGLGRDIADASFTEMAAAVTADDIAAIVYTSGTTGVPKGAMLTHDNFTFTAQSVEKCVEWRPDDDVFLFLPLAHVFARITVYASLLTGCALTFNRSMDTLAADLKAARPHWFPSVPRVYEKVMAKILAGAEAKGGAALKIFRWALAVGYRVSDLKLNRKPTPPVLGLKYKLATKLVFSKIQAALGGRVRWCISGAAPLIPDVGRFFHAAGILIVEGIGMTENTSFSNLNRYDNYRFGWVGPPGPGIEQQVAADGEILYRGRNVMKGYYKMPQETTDTFTHDGWLKTGDLGQIDADNFLRITGRKKEILVTSGGKNIAPALIEIQIGISRYINQICVVGDHRNYLTALITLDPEATGAYAQENGITFSSMDDLCQHPEIVKLIDTEIAQRNTDLASFETIKKFVIVPEFTIENGLLTPTFKVKKNIVLEQYKARIDSMYG
jgi:long-chain acyl-CoA synthetase